MGIYTHFFYCMQNAIVEKAKEIVAPLLEKMGAEAVDITYKREGPVMGLRLYVDKPNGISMDQCAEINSFLSAEFETLNIIQEPYIIEVSSPGLDRPLKNPNDYKRSIGKHIRITTYAPIDGKHEHIGILIGYTGENVVLTDEEGVSSEIPFEKIASARLHITF